MGEEGLNQPWDFPEDTVEIIDKEPGVINNALIKEAYSEMKSGQLEAGVPFDKMKELRLEFYDILRIDHLNMCTQLTKLSLSNNVIKEITNLNKLVNLVSLNLSFNRITKIRGLEALGKLEELSFFSNKITEIENLDAQKNTMRILSLGCNKLHSSSCLIYLRRFKKLSSLNIEENPFVENSTFNIVEIVGGMLPMVNYYNYSMIRPQMREQGTIKLRSLLNKLQEVEAEEKLTNKMNDFTENLSLYLEKSFISGFNDNEFYLKMMSRDVEGQKLDGICDNISAVFQRLQDGLIECSKNIIKYGVSFYNQRKLEVANYKEEHTNDMLDITHQSTVVIRDFMTSKTNLLKSLLSLYNEPSVNEETAGKRLQRAIICDKDFTLSRRKAWWDLMEQEMLRHDKNENNLIIFEDRLIELGKTFSEKIQVEFLSMRNMEDEFFISLSDQVNKYLVEIHMSQGPIKIAEHFKALLLHKEKREKIIGQSHKNHLSEIETEEEKLLNQVKEWQTSLTKTFCLHTETAVGNEKRKKAITTPNKSQHQTNHAILLHQLDLESLPCAEIERNRKAIIEINRFISHHKKDWAFQTEKALSNAYSLMKSIDPTWTHELIRIKMNSKERMLDDQMEAMFRERFLATTMRKRMEVQVKEEQGDASVEQADLQREEKRELDIRAKRRAYRFAYATLLRRDTQMESIHQTWNSAEDISAHSETGDPESKD